MNIRQQSDNHHQCKMSLKMKMNTTKKQLYSWKTQNKQLRVTWSKSSGTCSSPEFLWWSIHCRWFLSVQSFATLVLTGTTPLAAVDCCSSVTHAPKRLGFFRLNYSLFSLADLKEFVTGYCCSHLLHLLSTVRIPGKVEWCQPISLQMTQWNQVSRMTQ